MCSTTCCDSVEPCASTGARAVDFVIKRSWFARGAPRSRSIVAKNGNRETENDQRTLLPINRADTRREPRDSSLDDERMTDRGGAATKLVLWLPVRSSTRRPPRSGDPCKKIKRPVGELPTSTNSTLGKKPVQGKTSQGDPAKFRVSCTFRGM